MGKKSSNSNNAKFYPGELGSVAKKKVKKLKMAEVKVSTDNKKANKTEVLL